jgi:hypothetical protein
MQQVTAQSIAEQHTDPKRRFCDVAQFTYLRFNFDGTVALFNENSAVASFRYSFGKRLSSSLRALVFPLRQDLIIFNKRA